MKFFHQIREYLPTRNDIEGNRHLSIFGDSLTHGGLWRFNRNSVARGVAIGLFCAFLPMPFETVAAAFVAVSLGGNLPLAVAGVWISNPLTWVPLYTPCYKLGAKTLSIEPIPIEQINILSLGLHYVALWLGCLIVGSLVGLFSYLLINLIWREGIRQKWKKRKLDRQSRKKPNTKITKK